MYLRSSWGLRENLDCEIQLKKKKQNKTKIMLKGVLTKELKTYVCIKTCIVFVCRCLWKICLQLSKLGNNKDVFL